MEKYVFRDILAARVKRRRFSTFDLLPWSWLNCSREANIRSGSFYNGEQLSIGVSLNTFYSKAKRRLFICCLNHGTTVWFLSCGLMFIPLHSVNFLSDACDGQYFQSSRITLSCHMGCFNLSGLRINYLDLCIMPMIVRKIGIYRGRIIMSEAKGLNVLLLNVEALFIFWQS